ncbi:hypothetical protein HCUR_00359 [Holospora curviuscula]|uniref:Uncharacterized protein n=1 Tax=Holospora curviuscula TaxID=1082868 RepID=A0A2S5RAT3_9PROT|nr:hypothetical protein HCUR_00359 [Holospora curviuscula]
MENFDFKKLLADKGYDADNIVHYTGRNKAVMPTIYAKNLVERMFKHVNPFQARYT